MDKILCRGEILHYRSTGETVEVLYDVEADSLQEDKPPLEKELVEHEELTDDSTWLRITREGVEVHPHQVDRRY
ncbi:hypothetical protein ACCS93_36895 [Rhizobium ruizarguesonis]